MQFTKDTVDTICWGIVIRQGISDKRAKLREILTRLESQFRMEGRDQAIEWGEEYFRKELV